MAKMNAEWVNKNGQHFDITQITDLTLLFKPLGGLNSDAQGLYVDGSISDLRGDVLDRQIDNTLDPGATPSTGDRYIIEDSANLNSNFGTIVGISDNDIVEYDGTDFVITYDASSDENSNALAWVENENAWYHYDGFTWHIHQGLSLLTAGNGIDITSNVVSVNPDDVTIESPAGGVTIKNIDYIIDDDNQSIDGSDTPMVDAHRELVTREYVDTNISTNSVWTLTGTQLKPTDVTADNILIDVDHNGYNIISLENINTGNAAGSVFEAHKSNTAYQDNVYMGIYSDNFWIPTIAGKGVLFTDQDLVIGTVDVNKNINFLVGNSYSSPVVVGHLNQNGLYLDTIQTTSVHPASYHNLFVDASNGLIYASSTGTTGDSPQTDTIVVDATIVTNKTFTLTQTYNTDKQIYVYQNGLLLEDIYEWTVASNVITFTENMTPLTIDDRIVIKYYY